ncbi:MAG: 2-C-methyl-D-erythritol 2,4-cyclodiphosphate synthase [Candidatus Cloacimonas sp. 4484_143]|nr:MAG: 2-C-methyl-D-erythritol 2,4-cyclodiphosphate synthase [Candidatus Cloacimonas sp. 4484_143]RLC52229.1 MAG: 2-C-methyl-D-erythritol 2,4-cyclodiphosphate synthase [Candidatus Cloacimonadota bacterium]RLC54086.1 MAG: 2-C-methyl-D-erythritol 2,4-cyclodiphosphate synthase [Candidatus Cloacimonadota bacterium]
MRIGLGYDVHRLVDGRKLILGGVEIPDNKGLLGHSDADVLIHAVIDSILGALALGDIGSHFPDNNDEYKGINSRILLTKTFQKIEENNYCIGNLDATICAEYPKLQPYLLQMRENLAADLKTDLNNISIKATTEEGLGITGKQAGMSAYCVVLLQKK